jgi:hypothetical protein
MNTRHERQAELTNALLHEVELRHIPVDEAIIALSSALMMYIELTVPSRGMREAIMDRMLNAMRRTADEIEERREPGGDLWMPEP